MMEDRDDFFEDEEIMDAVSRFEEMLRNRTRSYFDVEELEGIIDFYVDADDLKSALKASSLADQLHPTNISIQLKKALILMDRNNFEDASSILNNLQQFEIINPEITLTRIRLHLAQGDTRQADRIGEQLVQRVQHKLEMLQEISNLFDQYFYFEEAEKYLRKVYLERPEDKELLFDYSFLAVRAGKTEESIKLFNNYLDLEPYSEIIWFNLGNAYFNVNKFAEAIEAFDFALAINDSFYSALFSKALSLFQQGNYSEAIKVYHECIVTDEDISQSYYHIGECYEKMDQKDEAYRYFTMSFDEDPENSDPLYGLSIIDAEREKYQEALKHIQHAIALDDEVVEYWFLLGKIQLKQNDFAISISSFEKATELDPHDTEAWFNLSFALVKAGEIDKAILILNEAMELNVDDADIHYHLAANWFFQGDKHMALTHFQKALVIDQKMVEDLFDFYPELEQHEDIRLALEKFGLKME